MSLKILQISFGQMTTRLQLQLRSFHIKNNILAFPGGSVVKNLPANAGDVGSISGLGMILHTLEQLSHCTTAPEPVLSSLGGATTEACVPWSPCSGAREATTMRSL